MKLRSIGRFLIVRTDYDLIDELSKKTVIALPRETMDKLKGGFQIHTVLSMGESAFDDEPPSVIEIMKREGRQVVTGRYPGHEIDFNPLAQDKEVVRHRIISSDEVHAVVAFDDEVGIHVN